MIKCNKLFILFCVCLSAGGPIFSVSASTILSGNIGGMTLEKTNSPYIIKKDIFIPIGAKTVIKEGVALLFESFTGMIVSGSLYVEGSSALPVSFSTVQDANHNDSAATLPEAFDWNGIVIERNAGEVKMRNFEVLYSVYGIKSKKRDIVLVNAVFRDNGQYNFTINDELMMVDEKVSYSYNAKREKVNADSMNVSAMAQRLASLSPKERKLRSASLVALIAGSAGCVGSGVLFGLASKYNNLYTNEKIDLTKIHDYKNSYYSFRNAGIATAAGSCAVLATSLVLYLVHKKNGTEQPKTQIKVSFINNDYSFTRQNSENKPKFGIRVTGNF